MNALRLYWQKVVDLVLEELRNAKRKAVGVKQTVKAVQSGEAKAVYIAADAEEHVLRPLHAALSKRPVQVYEVESMIELGKACKIDVGASACALL